MSATVEAAKDIGWKSLFAGLAAFASTAVLLACYARRIARRWALRLEGMAAAVGMALRFLARDPLRHALIGLWYGLWLALGYGLVPTAAIPLGLIGAFVSLAWLEQEGII